jgi:hypothetical protein
MRYLTQVWYLIPVWHFIAMKCFGDYSNLYENVGMMCVEAIGGNWGHDVQRARCRSDLVRFRAFGTTFRLS